MCCQCFLIILLCYETCSIWVRLVLARTFYHHFKLLQRKEPLCQCRCILSLSSKKMKLRSSYEPVYCKSNNSVTTQLHGFNLQIKYYGQRDIFFIIIARSWTLNFALCAFNVRVKWFYFVFFRFVICNSHVRKSYPQFKWIQFARKLLLCFAFKLQCTRESIYMNVMAARSAI